MTPPSSGPTATEAPTVAPQMPNAVPRSRPWNASAMSASDWANMIAPPIPWTPRARLRESESSARPQASEARLKTARPTTKTFRRPSRSPRDPAVSRNAASVSEYASITHWMSAKSACSERPMSGSATFTIVMSSSSMNTATHTTINVSHFRSTCSMMPNRMSYPVPAQPPAPSDHWRRVPRELISRLRADPRRAPEHIALAAADLHAPAAAAWAAKQHARGIVDPVTLGRMAKRRHARLARLEGAATGLGGWTTTAADLVGLAWIQSRLVFYVAGAYDFDPRDRMRPAELLVLTEVYSDVTAARDALDGAGRHMALAYAQSRLAGRGGRKDNRLLVSLAAFAGRHAAERGLGRYIPFVGAPLNAVANELDTRRLADRAMLFYGG